MPDDPDTQSILIMGETASISTRRVASGRVTISTRTEEIDRILPAELASVEVSVVQVPVDRKINSVPEVVAEGDLTIIPVINEHRRLVGAVTIDDVLDDLLPDDWRTWDDGTPVRKVGRRYV